MKSSVIAKGNPVHDLVLGLAPYAEAHAVEPFDLQRSEERFGDRIVPAIALAAHRAFHFEVPQELAVVVAGVLTAAIRMKDQACSLQYAVNVLGNRHYPKSLSFEAKAEKRNIRRAYAITAAVDLFGFVIVERRWGRIGTRLRHSKSRSFATMREADRHIEQLIARRFTARQRIGVGYRLIESECRA